MSFDMEQFMNTTLEGVNSTEVPQLQPGEYIGVLGKPKGDEIQGRKDPSKTYLKLSVPVSIDVPADQRETVGRDKTTVTYDLMLDRTPSGGIDMGQGKNVGLGRLREATDLNKPGTSFSFAMLEGRPVKVRIEHELYNGKAFAKVRAVSKP